MRLSTWQTLVVLGMFSRLYIRQWDIVGGYLQAKLKHVVYVSDTSGGREIEYWKLHKTLYRLKQAGYE